MNKQLQDKEIDKLYHRLSLQYNISKDIIKQIVESPYEFTEQQLDDIDINLIQSEEDEGLLKTNFIYKYIGKLHTGFKLINRRRKQSEAFKEINKKKWKK